MTMEELLLISRDIPEINDVVHHVTIPSRNPAGSV